MDFDKIIDDLTFDELVGQTLCYDIYAKDDPVEVEKILSTLHVGGIFMAGGMTEEQVRLYTKIAQKYTPVPVIVAADVEYGAGNVFKGEITLPNNMAWGATDDAELIERAGRVTGQICRKKGVHWTFSPVVDINYNFRSPETNIRAISDDPKHIVKIAKAFIKGMQDDGNMVTCAKHFPGQGVDERNSHFCTAINTLSKEEWMSTYGFVYKEMFKAGVPSVMTGHVALPSYEDDIDEVYGAPPAGVSYSLMTKLLKGELGFDGCIVSDAMSMVGISAAIPDIKKLGASFLKAGGDMILFPEPTDHGEIKKAVENGELSMERLRDAVKRVLKLKDRVRLFEENNEEREKAIVVEDDAESISQEIADRSVCVVRDYDGIIPSDLPSGSKILIAGMLQPYAPTGKELDALKDEFEKYGHSVTYLNNPGHNQIKKIMDEYDMIVLCSRISSCDYHGGSLRLGWSTIMALWRAYILQHKRFVCVSFGDPYKLFDMPYLKEYVNAFSFTESSQRAVAKVLLGKIKAVGKSPVELKGFFKREV